MDFVDTTSKIIGGAFSILTTHYIRELKYMSRSRSIGYHLIMVIIIMIVII